MTKEENIATLNEHLTHWKRLLSEKICDQSEGEKTIDALQNAIKALEKEPCDDCIRRSDIGFTNFEIVMCNGDYKEGLKMLLDKIEKAPSVTPIQKWIPVSEGLPEIHNFCQLYLVTYKQGQICTAFYTETNGRSWWSIDGVEAWMPLPEPYKQEVEE